PRDDLAADAIGHVIGEFAVEVLGPAGVMVEMPDDQRDIDITALADRLAVIEGLEDGKEPRVLLDQAGDGIEIFAALVARKRGPGLLRGAGGLYGFVDIGRSPVGNLRQRLVGGGIF